MEKITKASLFHWLWKEEVCVASPHPPFCRLLESVIIICATRHVSVPGPIRDMGWVAVVPGSCLFPLVLSSWCWDPLHPEQELTTSV